MQKKSYATPQLQKHEPLRDITMLASGANGTRTGSLSSIPSMSDS